MQTINFGNLSLKLRGAWDEEEVYRELDVVRHANSLWGARGKVEAGEEPGVGGAWMLLVLGGDADVLPAPGTVPLRGPQGEVKAGAALAADDALTKGAFDAAMAQKLGTAAFNTEMAKANRSSKGAFPGDTFINLSAPASGGQVSAPYDGYMYCSGTSTAAGGRIYGWVGGNGVPFSAEAYKNGQELSVWAPIAKNYDFHLLYANVSQIAVKFAKSLGGV